MKLIRVTGNSGVGKTLNLIALTNATTNAQYIDLSTQDSLGVSPDTQLLVLDHTTGKLDKAQVLINECHSHVKHVVLVGQHPLEFGREFDQSIEFSGPIGDLILSVSVGNQECDYPLDQLEGFDFLVNEPSFQSLHNGSGRINSTEGPDSSLLYCCREGGLSIPSPSPVKPYLAVVQNSGKSSR